MKKLLALFMMLCVWGVASNTLSQETTPTPREYRDARGKVVSLPLGDLSFADRVVRFEAGNPSTQDPRYRNPEAALGPPNYVGPESPDSTTLGCGGTLVLEFVDNALVNGPGADLHIFEVGPAVEPMQLAISEDGERWIEIGRISGGTASVDIEKFIKPDAAFRFVKLTDLKSDCGGSWPGADIDAVAAVGSAIRVSLSSMVLFDVDKSELKPQAASELTKAAARVKEIPQARVVIEGHTDNMGSDEHNRRLSESRALAVKAFLQPLLEGRDYTLQAHGYGEARPRASNTTEQGRQENRRVELVIIPVTR